MVHHAQRDRFAAGENLVATRHPRIQMANERVIPLPELERLLGRLKEALDCGNRAILRERLADFIADEQQEGAAVLTMARSLVTDG